jgi:hypothetical protein
MKALSVRQPYASLIVAGIKKVENRSWRPPEAIIGDVIAIHAGKAKPSQSEMEEASDQFVSAGLPPRGSPRGFPLGGIVGYVRLIGYAEPGSVAEDGLILSVTCTVIDEMKGSLESYLDTGWNGSVGWLLEDAQEAEFVPLPGRLGLFDI